MRSRLLAAATALAVLSGGCAAEAATIVATAASQGWIDHTGFRETDLDNYIVGNCSSDDCEAGGEFRNFFTFDIPEFEGAIASVELVLDNGLIFLDQDLAATLQITSLTNMDFDSLGAGTIFGSHTYTGDDAGQTQGILLNNAAIAALGHGGGVFGLSGRLISATAFGGGEADQLLFGSTEGRPSRLIITLADPAAVPEPGAWALIIVGLGGLGGALRIRRRVASAAPAC